MDGTVRRKKIEQPGPAVEPPTPVAAPAESEPAVIKPKVKRVSKREKIQRVLDCLDIWVATYREENELDFDKTCEELISAYEAVKLHGVIPPKADHPDCMRYIVTLADGSDTTLFRAITRARCRYCGSEMEPSSFLRHYKKSKCLKLHDKRFTQDDTSAQK